MCVDYGMSEYMRVVYKKNVLSAFPHDEFDLYQSHSMPKYCEIYELNLVGFQMNVVILLGGGDVACLSIN